MVRTSRASATSWRRSSMRRRVIARSGIGSGAVRSMDSTMRMVWRLCSPLGRWVVCDPSKRATAASKALTAARRFDNSARARAVAPRTPHRRPSAPADHPAEHRDLHGDGPPVRLSIPTGPGRAFMREAQRLQPARRSVAAALPAGCDRRHSGGRAQELDKALSGRGPGAS
jgi:hypothetical protein